jgi:phosphoribosyl 1,2-cyclic phosphate phosphodiesterase
MEIQLLGTGASDGIPAFFAESRVTDYARLHRGKDVRMRSAALIDGHLKIDFGPDTYNQIEAFDLHANEWSAILFTHADADHFSVKELQYSMFPFSDAMHSTFAIYANETICERLRYHYPEWPIEFHETVSFQPFEHAGYQITPIKANHSSGEDCHNLIIDDGHSKFLYATDTGIWPEKTWEFLSGIIGIQCLVIECTNGKNHSNYHGHLNLEECLFVVERLRTMGTLSHDCRIVTTHHSHEGDMTHAELEVALALHRIEPGFDGITLQIGT